MGQREAFLHKHELPNLAPGKHVQFWLTLVFIMCKGHMYLYCTEARTLFHLEIKALFLY
jgi:hypothetical protein